jgi:hypothetical protein
MQLCLILCTLILAPLVVDSSSASSPRPSSLVHTSVNGGSTSVRSSDNLESIEKEEVSSSFLFGVRRSNSSAVDDADDGIFFVRKREGSNEPLQEEKVEFFKDLLRYCQSVK